MYNIVKQKLANGEQVIGGTIETPDPQIYRAMARAGFDFLWIEMQHSPLTYQEVARMIWAGRDLPAIPFIRVPDATEGDIQKATDVGALGIIVPMVVEVQKVEAAVRFAKYPPDGARSLGGGQYGELWGSDYRKTANDNIMIVGMIESPAGVENAEKIASVPGVDVVFAAASPLVPMQEEKRLPCKRCPPETRKTSGRWPARPGSKQSGFSVHAGASCKAGQQKKLERL